jgi:hypothetical protein
MVPTILRSEALKFINSGQPFSLEFVTADVRRGTGGKLISVKNWMKVSGESTEERAPGQKPAPKQVPGAEKNPNHFQHKTINIYNPANRSVHVHKVHFRLILSINGKKVING